MKPPLIIEIESSASKGLYLPSINILECIPETALFNKERKLRHPLGIYNVSTSGVLKNFLEVAKAMSKYFKGKSYLNDKGDKTLDEILKKQKDLLYSLEDHIDDCKNIIKCLHPSRLNKESHNHIKLFLKKIDDYDEHIGHVVNKIKHKQGRLRGITFFNSDIAIPGYFVEGINKEGALGPDEEIHHGGDTAFSFSRNLRFHFFSLYFISQELGKIIENFLGNNIMKPSSAHKGDAEIIVKVVNEINKIPAICFPDECKQPMPDFKLSRKTRKHKKIIQLFLSYAPVSKTIILPELKGMGFSVNYAGDGVTKSFKIPYS